MNCITHPQLRELAKVEHFPCISIYLPTHRDGADQRGNIVSLRNALQTAEGLLIEKSWTNEAAADFLKAARHLSEDAHFWAQPRDGFAFMINTQRNWAFHLPVAFTEMVKVDSHFHLAPLAAAVNVMNEFLVLALSEKRAKLYLADADGLRDVIVPRMPASLRASHPRALEEAQTHVVSGARLGDSKESAVFHGQGDNSSMHESDVRAYCREVSDAIGPILARQGVPLVVAAVERLAAEFASVSDDPHLIPKNVRGCPDHWPESELLAKAQSVTRAYQSQCDATDTDRISELVGMGLAAEAPAAVLAAACHGQVNELFVAKNAEMRGRYDSATGEVHLAPRGSDGDDLVELAVRETLRHNGVVRTVAAEALHKYPIAAWLRYVGN